MADEQTENSGKHGTSLILSLNMFGNPSCAQHGALSLGHKEDQVIITVDRGLKSR